MAPTRLVRMDLSLSVADSAPEADFCRGHTEACWEDEKTLDIQTPGE